MALIKKGRTYYYVSRQGGRQVWMSLRTKSKEEALIRQGELLRQRGRERFGVPLDRKELPWPELVQKILGLKKGNGDCDGTIRRAKHIFMVIDRTVNICRASDWSAEQLEKFKRLRLAEGKLPSTINKELEAIKMALRKARQWGYVAPSLEELQSVAKIKDHGHQAYFFPDEDASRLLAAASPFWRAAILLGLLGGLRRSESLQLRWEDVDFERGEIRIVNRPGAPTKTRSSRTIPMHEALAEVLKSWRVMAGPSPRTLGRENLTEESKQVFSRTFRRMLDRLGFPKQARYHSLRHTLASNMARADVNQKKIADILGHTTLRMTALYTHVTMEDMRSALLRVKMPGKSSNGSSNVSADKGQFQPPLDDNNQPMHGGDS